MNILVISAQKPDGTGSGVYLAQTARAFVEAGHRVAVVAGIDVADPQELTFAIGSGPVCSDMPERSCSLEFYPVQFNTPELPFNVCGMSDVMPYQATRYRDVTPKMLEQFYAAFTKTISHALRACEPDLVLCHHLYLVTALTVRITKELRPHCPVAAICHSTDIRQMRSHSLEREQVIEGVRGLDRVFALHEEQAKQIAEVYGVNSEHIEIIGTGYDNRVFRSIDRSGGEKTVDQNCRMGWQDENPDGLDCQAGQQGGHADDPDRRIELCFVGKVSRAKGVLSLIRCLAELPRACGDVRLRLVGGSGSEEEVAQAHELAKQVPYEVEFCGRIPTKDVVDIYNTSDIFVLPSFYEGLPLVTIEAMACGCRVVMTDLPGVRPWLKAQLPDAPVVFVTPPRMLPGTVDEPDPIDLPVFESKLAATLADAINAARHEPRPSTDTSSLTWTAVAERILSPFAS